MNVHAEAPSADFAGEVTVSGWHYFTAKDRDDDVEKILHYVTHQDTGKTHHINWTPYSYMAPIDIKRMADMGWPPSNSTTPANVAAAWTARDCELAHYRWLASYSGIEVPASPKDTALSYTVIGLFALLALIILQFFIRA